MSALGTKLRRDLWRLKGQVATIALVLACGFMAMLTLRSAWTSLGAARDDFYADYRFGDGFARVVRAPDTIVPRLEAIPGIARVYPRLVLELRLVVPGEADPVVGRIVSLPDGEPAPLDALYLRAGRLPAAGAPDEVVVLAQYAAARGVALGDRIVVVLEGRLRSLAVVGIGLSPGYVFATSGASALPDPRGFAVLWMPRAALAPAVQMAGAFNDVVVAFEPGAAAPAVLAALDRELAPYGGFHAVGRDQHASHAMLAAELDCLRVLALIIPTIFLAIAAFLVNVVVSRVVGLERTQIAILKALGYTTWRITAHYLVLVAAIVAVGAVAGVAVGTRTAGWMLELFGEYFQFPARSLAVDPAVVAGVVALGLGAAVAGAARAIREVTRLPPAEAMRAPAPARYRRSLAERLRLDRAVGAAGMMVVRELERRPLRFAASVLGIAMAVAVVLFGRFGWDSYEALMAETYPREHPADVTVTFRRPVPARALHELARVPGVHHVEGQRRVACRLRAANRAYDGAITGLEPGGVLRVLLHRDTQPTPVPPAGLLVNARLAARLGVAPGDALAVEVFEGAWTTRSWPIAGVLDEAFGLEVYASAAWLAAELGEAARVSGALLAVDPAARAAVRAHLQDLPEVFGVTTRDDAIRAYEEVSGESMATFVLVLTLSAAVIAVGIIYNNARIALSLRSRELATLRVIGFSRRELSGILLGELAAQVALGIPLGLAVGTWGVERLTAAMATDQLRFTVTIAGSSYVLAALIALGSAAASALLVRRKLDRLDLLAVLKAAG